MYHVRFALKHFFILTNIILQYNCTLLINNNLGKKMTVNTISTSFTLTKDVLESLQKEADKRMCSRSAVVRLALIGLFEKGEK